jgi:predicted methyltransferase
MIGDVPRRWLLAGGGVSVLAACGPKAKAPRSGGGGSALPVGSLPWALAGDWRSDADRQQDKALHPQQTLEFFGLAPGMTVVEIWPGAGWWTQILAPYLAANKGKLYAATFEVPNPDDPAAGPVVQAYRKMITDKPAIYGDVTITGFGPNSGALAPDGSADLVLFFNLDNWMAAGLAEKAFHNAYDALKPGGVLGVVQARAPVGAAQDPLASNGRVQVDFVKQMAVEAGFVFDKASEINANPKDGMEGKRLLPFARPIAPDRMTLRFLKR